MEGVGHSFLPKETALVSPRSPWDSQHLPRSGQPSVVLCSPSAGGDGGRR